jgi:hypothetical protein
LALARAIAASAQNNSASKPSIGTVTVARAEIGNYSAFDLEGVLAKGAPFSAYRRHATSRRKFSPGAGSMIYSSEKVIHEYGDLERPPALTRTRDRRSNAPTDALANSKRHQVPERKFAGDEAEEN